MHAKLFLAGLALPFLAMAAPAPKRLPTHYYPRQTNETAEACDLSNLAQPANTLKAPSTFTPSISLVLVALGRGTQNYTCANSTAAPVQIGAVATLFNASCSVASNPTDTTLGTISEDAASIGAHFFVDSTTPDFDIIGLGNTQAKKIDAMAAPSTADIAWLRLEAQVAQSESPVRQIYRLNTKGGLAPTSCAGSTPGETIAVEYEAQYWIYACDEAMKNLKAKRRATV